MSVDRLSGTSSHITPRQLHRQFACVGAAIRALHKWLRDTKTDVSSQVQVGTDVQSHSLPLPDMPSSMTFTRSTLLDCVKRNFRKDSSKIESFGPQQQDVAREMLGFRCVRPHHFQRSSDRVVT